MQRITSDDLILLQKVSLNVAGSITSHLVGTKQKTHLKVIPYIPRIFNINTLLQI